MIKNYIFDLYGTLIHIRTNEEKKEVWQAVEPYYLKDSSILKESYHLICKEEFEKLKVLKQSEHPEIDILRVFERMGPVLYDSVEEIALIFRKASREIFALYPNTVFTLKALKEKGKKIYLLSNAQAAFTMDELDQAGLTPIFDGICISSSFGIKKPDARFMQHLLEMYDLKVDECIMIGNDFESDIAIANAVGMKAVHINTDHFPKDYIESREYEFEEIEKLEELL